MAPAERAEGPLRVRQNTPDVQRALCTFGGASRTCANRTARIPETEPSQEPFGNLGGNDALARHFGHLCVGVHDPEVWTQYTYRDAAARRLR